MRRRGSGRGRAVQGRVERGGAKAESEWCRSAPWSAANLSPSTPSPFPVAFQEWASPGAHSHGAAASASARELRELSISAAVLQNNFKSPTLIFKKYLCNFFFFFFYNVIYFIILIGILNFIRVWSLRPGGHGAMWRDRGAEGLRRGPRRGPGPQGRARRDKTRPGHARSRCNGVSKGTRH